MFEWVKLIGQTVQTTFNIALFVINFFSNHILPCILFLKRVIMENDYIQFPLALATLASTVGICMIIRFLWNAIRGAGA